MVEKAVASWGGVLAVIPPDFQVCAALATRQNSVRDRDARKSNASNPGNLCRNRVPKYVLYYL